MNLKPITLISKTSSFILLRIILCSIIIYPLFKSVDWGISFGYKYAHSRILLTDILWAYLGFSACYILVELIRKPLIHWLTYAHVAAMTDIIDGNELASPLKSGFTATFTRMGATAGVFVVDGLLVKAVKQVSAWIMENSGSLPKFLRQGVFHRVVKQSLEVIVYSVTECVMSYLYRNPEVNIWEGAVKGATLYVKSWKSVLKSAFIFTIQVKLFMMVLRFLTLVLCAYITWDKGLIAIISAYIAARVLFMLIEVTIVQPYQLASMLLSLDRETEGEEPDSAVSENLAGISDSFREMVQHGSRAGGEYTEEVAKKITSVLPVESLTSSINLPGWAKDLFKSNRDAS